MKKIIQIENNNIVIFDKYMFNSKHVFIMLLMIITVFTFFLTDSYSMFTKKDHLININFIAGKLNYTLESSILDNGKVTVDAKNEFKLTVTLNSLNSVDTKYELYYLVNGEKKTYKDLQVNYTDESEDSVSGVIEANGSKQITINIVNLTNRSLEITFGCEGGLVNNELVMSQGLKIVKTVDMNNTVMAYTYVGNQTEPSKFPEKDDGYFIQNLTCTGGEAVWNNEIWAMEIISTSGDTLKCVAEVTDIFNDESGAGKPTVGGNMIPVTYDSDNNTWIKADVKSKWYDYNEKMWANAVTVTPESRADYLDADYGIPISMDDITTMWVWIPRFEYKTITSNVGTEIQINFLDKDESNKTANYITHPAFKMDDNLAGIWVGKFETSSRETCTPNYSSIDRDCDLTSLNVQIKPNVTSWRGIRTSTAFIVSRNMVNTDNIYGFNGDKIDPHMMKNTEWGAVAYLSQSKYGRCNDGVCQEIMLNNNNKYITGIAANGYMVGESSSTDNKYDTEKGVLASTTGNIYGIYDMSGGAYEYVMGVMQDNSGKNVPMSGFSKENNSGFASTVYDTGNFTIYNGSSRSFPDSKYFDLYNYGTSTNDDNAYNRYITGDATKETLRWNDDYTTFVNHENPWFHRGGTFYEYAGAGIFNFNRESGHANSMISFRVVLAVK